MNINPNAPAFPQTIDDMGTLTSVTSGLTVRAYIATKAMSGILASEEGAFGGYRDPDALAEASLQATDALIAKLNE